MHIGEENIVNNDPYGRKSETNNYFHSCIHLSAIVCMYCANMHIWAHRWTLVIQGHTEEDISKGSLPLHALEMARNNILAA